MRVDSLTLDALASTEAAVSPEEREHGVVVVDIGGGTTDLAVVVRGAVVHSAVLPVGGAQMTGDLVIALRVPQPAAEQAKREHGHAIPSMVEEDETVEVDAFGAEGRKTVERRLIAEVLQARTEELLEMVRAEVRRGAQEELLAAGIVLTGVAQRRCRESTRSPRRCWGYPPASAGLVISRDFRTCSTSRPTQPPLGCCAGRSVSRRSCSDPRRSRRPELLAECCARLRSSCAWCSPNERRATNT